MAWPPADSTKKKRLLPLQSYAAKVS
uniref:Uncharacterized protein n=1 Tax=Pyricularia oryzae (strain P131) TaxID=1143193 RepID=L7J852_PYRO1